MVGEKIRAVLFDLDNTLIDFSNMKRECCRAAIAAMIDAGLPLSEEEAMKRLFSLYKVYGIEHKQIFQKFLRKIMGKIDYRILAKGIAAYRRRQSGILSLYPHVRSTLLKLKAMGLKLAIVSDAPRLNAWLRLAEMDLVEYFDVVITAGDVKKKKPHGLPFKSALKKLGLKADEVLFVGDNPQKDIAGAKKLGIKSCLAKYGQVFKGKAKADFELNDIAELLPIVKRLNSS